MTGWPLAPPASAACPAPTRTRPPASSSASCPTCRSCPSCRRAARTPTSPAAAPRCSPTCPSTCSRPAGASSPGRSRDGTRARDLLARDLDALEEVVAGAAAGRAQGAGDRARGRSPPLLELPRGDRALADHGAVADLDRRASPRACAGTSPTWRGRLPGHRAGAAARRAGAAGRAAPAASPPPSGFGRLRVPERPGRQSSGCATVLARRASAPSCTAAPRARRSALLVARGRGRAQPRRRACSRRTTTTRSARRSRAAPALLLGLVPSTDARPVGPHRAGWSPRACCGAGSGFAHDRLPGTVVVTPTCGLAGATPGVRPRGAARRAPRSADDWGRSRSERARWSTASRPTCASGTASCPARSTSTPSATTCSTRRRSRRRVRRADARAARASRTRTRRCARPTRRRRR